MTGTLDPHDADPRGELAPGSIIEGRYRVDEILGRGGFATVYRAEHLQLKREVALKVLDQVGQRGSEAGFLQRFEREAQIAARLEHPNIARVFDFGRLATGEPYIVMERLEGHDLEQEIGEVGPIALDRALDLFAGALGALAAAHEAGIVHKDLKPSNLFLVRPGEANERLVVVDFGIAGFYEAPEARLTQEGVYTGTPAYAAPEYIREHAVSPALDVYQIGLILIEALSGEPAVRATTPAAFLIAHCAGEARVPAWLEPTPLGAVLRRALRVDPGERYRDAGELGEALERARRGDRPAHRGDEPARRRGPSGCLILTAALVLLALALVASVAGLAYLTTRGVAAPEQSLGEPAAHEEGAAHRKLSLFYASAPMLASLGHLIPQIESSARTPEKLDRKAALFRALSKADTMLEYGTLNTSKAALSDPAMPEIEDAARALIEASRSLSEVLAELNAYWIIEERWKVDGGARGRALEAKYDRLAGDHHLAWTQLERKLLAQTRALLARERAAAKPGSLRALELSTIADLIKLHEIVIEGAACARIEERAQSALERAARVHAQLREAASRAGHAGRPLTTLEDARTHMLSVKRECKERNFARLEGFRYYQLLGPWLDMNDPRRARALKNAGL